MVADACGAVYSHNQCDQVVHVFHPQANVSSFARVVDACGAVENSSFGCNDIYFTKGLFEVLAGNDTDAVTRGESALGDDAPVVC